MLYIYQLNDATESVSKIGLSNTIVLIVLLAVITSFGFIVRWLVKKIDKKDEQQIQLMEARQGDISKTESALRITADALRDNAQGLNSVKSSLDELAREIRSRRQKD